MRGKLCLVSVHGDFRAFERRLKNIGNISEYNYEGDRITFSHRGIHGKCFLMDFLPKHPCDLLSLIKIDAG